MSWATGSMSVRTHGIAKQLDTKRSYGNRIEDLSTDWALAGPKTHDSGRSRRQQEWRVRAWRKDGIRFPAPITGFDSVLPVVHLQDWRSRWSTTLQVLCDPPHWWTLNDWWQPSEYLKSSNVGGKSPLAKILGTPAYSGSRAEDSIGFWCSAFWMSLPSVQCIALSVNRRPPANLENRGRHCAAHLPYLAW